METKTLRVNYDRGDMINIGVDDYFPSEINISIWKNGGHAATSLTLEEALELAAALNEAIAVSKQRREKVATI